MPPSEVAMLKPEGNATLLPEPFEVRKDAVDKAAPAARAAATRISQAHKRRAADDELDPSDEAAPV